jgi:hypothetical protein
MHATGRGMAYIMTLQAKGRAAAQLLVMGVPVKPSRVGQ